MTGAGMEDRGDKPEQDPGRPPPGHQARSLPRRKTGAGRPGRTAEARPKGLPGKARWALRKLVSLPLFELAWALPAWVMLGLARIAVLRTPFRKLAPRLGVHSGIAPWVPLATPAQEQRANRIGRVVRRSAMFTPWQSNCFNQAITARLLLGLYGLPYCFYFGVRFGQDGTELDAHAWVASGKVRVTGATSFGRFTVVGCFVAPPLARAMHLDPTPWG